MCSATVNVLGLRFLNISNNNNKKDTIPQPVFLSYVTAHTVSSWVKQIIMTQYGTLACFSVVYKSKNRDTKKLSAMNIYDFVQ